MEEEKESDERIFIGPSWYYVSRTSIAIVGIGVLITSIIFLISIFSVVDQIQTGDWDEVSGTVYDVSNKLVESNDEDGTTSEITIVTVAYSYAGKSYKTDTFSLLSDGWGQEEEHWLNMESVEVYVNPDDPTQAVHLAGWDGVVYELKKGAFFTGLILGFYLFIGVPGWALYSIFQRFRGIPVPSELEVVVDYEHDANQKNTLEMERNKQHIFQEKDAEKSLPKVQSTEVIEEFDHNKNGDTKAAVFWER